MLRLAILLDPKQLFEKYLNLISGTLNNGVINLILSQQLFSIGKHLFLPASLSWPWWKPCKVYTRDFAKSVDAQLKISGIGCTDSTLVIWQQKRIALKIALRNFLLSSFAS